MRQFRLQSLGFVLLAIFVAAGVAVAQPKRSTGVKNDGPSEGPKRSTGVKEEQSLVTRQPGKDVSLNLASRARDAGATGKGVIVVVGVAGAEVELLRHRAGKSASPASFQLKGQNNTLTLSNLEPGEYLVSLSHPDYVTRTEKINLGAGDIKTLTELVQPKYGEIVIGGVPEGADIQLDGKVLPASALVRSEAEGQVSIRRLLDGEHIVTLSREGYDPWTRNIRVVAGRSVPETAEMRRATVTLTIKSIPGARVYLDRIDRGSVQPDGSLVIKDLEPAEKADLRVALEGYDDSQRNLKLSLSDRNPAVSVELRRTPESQETSEEFITGSSRWVVPQTWKLDRKGLHVSGDAVGLFKDPAEKRAFNYYANFDLSFDTRFENGRGASWIVRARDLSSYYLLELATASATGGLPRISFFVCRTGKCELKDSRPVVEKLDVPGDSYHVITEARGSQFTVKIRVLSTPRPDDPQKIAVFNDDTYQIGGVGFRGRDDNRILVQSLVVTPRGAAEK